MPGRQQIRKMPSFEGVAPGQTATLRMPVGLTYHDLLIGYNQTTGSPSPATMFDEIRVLANGRTLQRWSDIGDLNAVNAFDGFAAPTGGNDYIILPFDRRNLITRPGEELTAIGSGPPTLRNAEGNPDPTPLATLTCEVDLKDSVTGPELDALARQSQPAFVGLVKKVRTFIYPLVAGDIEIADLPRGDIINRIIIEAATVTRLQILVDNYTIFDRTGGANSRVQRASLYRTPQNGYFIYDPTEQGYGSEGIVTANVGDLRLIVTSSAADAGARFIVEYIGPLTL